MKLLIVDGHAYAYRAFYAIRSARGITMRGPVPPADGTIPRAELQSPSGAATNAVFGFIKMLAKMRASVAPTHALVVWDGGLDAERRTALPGYKAQRPEMPAELGAQIDEIAAYLAAAGVAGFCRDGVEADDVIAGVARRAARAGGEVVVASADKDFMQLVSPRIGLLNPNDKSETIWGAEQVRAKAGVNPGQIVDWLALIGDAVDNIPGVTGVGPKTAADLLNRFGTVDELYRQLGEVKSERLRAALAAAEGEVRRNVELVRLKDELAGEVDLDELAVQPANAERLRELFGRWGFRGMLAELGPVATAQAALF